MRTPRFIAPPLEERTVPKRRRDAEVAIRARRGDPATRRALEESRLEKVRLVEVLEGAAVLSDGRGDGADADGTAAEFFDDRRQDPPVDLVETVLVHLEPRQSGPRGVAVDRGLLRDLGEVAQAAQEPVRDARRAA